MKPSSSHSSTHRGLSLSLLLLTLASLGFGTPRPVQASGEFEVRYRSAEAVYLNAGTAAGLAVGDRLEIVRNSSVVAQIEVIFAAEHSASCRVLMQAGDIQPGDRARTSGPPAVHADRPADMPSSPDAGKDGAGSAGDQVDSQLPPEMSAEDAAPVFAQRGGITMEIVAEGPGCVEFRKAPRAISPQVGCLRKGTMGTMVGVSTANWRALWLADGRRGWVERKDLRLVAPTAVQQAAALSSPGALVYRVKDEISACLTLRSEPRLSATPRDCLEPDTRGTVTDSEGAWRKLLLGDGREGWVAARFIEPILPPGAASIAATSSSDRQTEGGNLEARRRDDPKPSGKAATGTSRAEEARLRSNKGRRSRVSGSLTVDWEDYSDEGQDPFDFQQFSARLSLRVREIGGSPYSFRLRMRTRENERTSLGSLSDSERQDRFYEMSLSYEPTEVPFAYRVGRITTSPIVSSGYMDGMLGSTSVHRNFRVGGFLGARSDVEQIGFESTGQIYGLFARLANPPDSSSQLRYDVVVAGSREEGETDVSREFVSLQSRLSSGSKWFIYQRAEFDLNHGWRKEASGSSSQLSNFSLTATRRIREISRLTLSYDRFEQYRTEETRSIPDELFNDLLRQGVRASLQMGKPRKLNFTLNAGLRTEEGEDKDTLSYGFSVRHPDVWSRDLSLSANVLGFSNPFNEGYVATVSATKRLLEGSQLSLSLGNRISRSVLSADLEDLSTQWARFGGWVELPKNLFANGEYEITTGDEYQGKRLSLGLGYRF